MGSWGEDARGGWAASVHPASALTLSPPLPQFLCFLQLSGKAVVLTSVRRCPTEPSPVAVGWEAEALLGDPRDKATSP